MLIFQFGKGIKYWKKNHGLFSPCRPASTALPAHPISPNRPASFPPPSCCQAGPGDSRTPRVSLTPSLVETVTQTDPFALVRPGKPIPFPLLLAAPPARKIPAPPRVKVLRPSHRGLPHHIPCLPAAVTPHCPFAFLQPQLRLCAAVAASGATAFPWTRRWETSLGQDRRFLSPGARVDTI
jgi:hypothetical protein